MKKRRIVTLLLALCFVCSLLPAAAHAADEDRTVYVGGVALTANHDTGAEAYAISGRERSGSRPKALA